jgi:hypothetical protein
LLRITPGQYAALESSGLDRLARRIAQAAPQLGDAQRFRGYVDQALAAGVEVERDVAELAMLLAQPSTRERRVGIASILGNADIPGAQKVSQVRFLLSGLAP